MVGAVGYTASVLSLLLSIFAVYSIPSVHSFLQFYRLDSWVYVLAGVVGGIGFGGPLVMWFVRRRKFTSLAQSIYWECSNRVLGWAFLVGFVFGIAYSLAKGMLAGRGPCRSIWDYQGRAGSCNWAALHLGRQGF
jgi:hypothetical protein